MKTVFIVASKFLTDTDGYTDIEGLVIEVYNNRKSAKQRAGKYNKDFLPVGKEYQQNETSKTQKFMNT